ncbi:OB-fold nucleic acid binding domain-containing protein, partial [Thermodesulfobacteriota bacterium]
VELTKVNKKVVESLIKCGAFDSTGIYRSRLMGCLEDSIEYGQRVQREKADPQMRLFDLGGSKEPTNHPPIPQINEWDKNELLTLEKEILGFYITDHPLSTYQDLLDKFTNTDTISVREHKDGSIIRIGGIVRNIKTIRTKKGDLMAFVTIEDMDGAVEVTIFSRVYAARSDVLVIDNPVLLQGQVQNDENAVKILADDIIPIEKAEETWIAEVRFKLDISRTTQETLSSLKEIFARHPGSCTGYVHLINPDKTETIIALPNTMRLKAGSELKREVAGLVGYPAMETVCSPATSSVSLRKNNFKEGKKRTI